MGMLAGKNILSSCVNNSRELRATADLEEVNCFNFNIFPTAPSPVMCMNQCVGENVSYEQSAEGFESCGFLAEASGRVRFEVG